MKMKISAPALKYVVDAASRLLDEGVMEFRADGMRIREMDASQIAMVDAFVPRKSFLEYPEFPTEGSDVVEKHGVNLKLMKQMVGKADEDITLEVVENKLVMAFGKKEFKMGLLDLQHNIRKVPKVENAAEFAIAPADFFGWLGDVSVASSHITFKTKEGKLRAVGTGDSGEVDDETGLTCEQEIEAIYPIGFLGKMKLSGDMKFYVKTNTPIRLSYLFDGISVDYLLAPRITS